MRRNRALPGAFGGGSGSALVGGGVAGVGRSPQLLATRRASPTICRGVHIHHLVLLYRPLSLSASDVVQHAFTRQPNIFELIPQLLLTPVFDTLTLWDLRGGEAGLLSCDRLLLLDGLVQQQLLFVQFLVVVVIQLVGIVRLQLRLLFFESVQPLLDVRIEKVHHIFAVHELGNDVELPVVVLQVVIFAVVTCIHTRSSVGPHQLLLSHAGWLSGVHFSPFL
mmetsp:Transcript_2260/g.3074  ORF Transcript_2260/g.3074 Transcript_2260/m.3074 type:complete len:222 (-) Transcript_2260:1191-1856(-)